MMDFQTGFNILLGAVSALGGWLLNNLYQSLRDLARVDSDLADKVQKIEVLVAGTYVKRSEFEAKIDALFDKLDSIEDKIDRKISSFKVQQ